MLLPLELPRLELLQQGLLQQELQRQQQLLQQQRPQRRRRLQRLPLRRLRLPLRVPDAFYPALISLAVPEFQAHQQGQDQPSFLPRVRLASRLLTSSKSRAHRPRSGVLDGLLAPSGCMSQGVQQNDHRVVLMLRQQQCDNKDAFLHHHGQV